MNLNSRKTLIARLQRGRKTRQQFVESHLAHARAHQIRAMRDAAGWTQQRLANEIGSTQNGVYKLESTSHTTPTLTTLRRVAAAFDVALVVRFVPFSELVDWVSGTPRLERGLRHDAIDVANFEREEKSGALADRPPVDPSEWPQTDDAPVERGNVLPFQPSQGRQNCLIEGLQQLGDHSRMQLLDQQAAKLSMAKASLHRGLQQSEQEVSYGQ